MKIDLKLSHESLTTITSMLYGVYNSKAITRRHKATLSIATDTVSKLDTKFSNVKIKTDLFSTKKKVTVSLKFHEADMLELLLLQEIKLTTNKDVIRITQDVINDLNQKLA